MKGLLAHESIVYERHMLAHWYEIPREAGVAI